MSSTSLPRPPFPARYSAPVSSRSLRRWGPRLFSALLLAVVLAQLQAAPSSAAVSDTWLDDAPANSTGWKRDFVDNFATSLSSATWGRYNGGKPTGTVSTYQSANVATNQTVQVGDGVLQLTSKKTNGAWTGAGVSSSPGFSAVRGKWVVKAKFDRAYGVGFAFLLMPKGGGWPPELDLIEGTMGGPHLMSTYHYGTASAPLQVQRWNYDVDMTHWHTYGVIVDANLITYTVDGTAWATASVATTSTKMWFGIQTGVKDCAVSTGECLSSATPTSSNISVDWVAHYARS